MRVSKEGNVLSSYIADILILISWRRNDMFLFQETAFKAVFEPENRRGKPVCKSQGVLSNLSPKSNKCCP